MAFGYKVPAFNVWFAYWYWHWTGPGDTQGEYLAPVYVRGQLRSGDRTGHGFGQEVALPKGSFVRSAIDVKGGNDLIQAAGWGDYFAHVNLAEVSGAGFANEHVVVLITARSQTFYNLDDVLGFNAPPVSTTLVPPEGFTPMAVIDPTEEWFPPYGVPIDT